MNIISDSIACTKSTSIQNCAKTIKVKCTNFDINFALANVWGKFGKSSRGISAQLPADWVQLKLIGYNRVLSIGYNSFGIPQRKNFLK